MGAIKMPGVVKTVIRPLFRCQPCATEHWRNQFSAPFQGFYRKDTCLQILYPRSESGWRLQNFSIAENARYRQIQTVLGIFLPKTQCTGKRHFVPQRSVLFRIVPFCLCQSCARKFFPYPRKPLVSLAFSPLFRFRCAVAQAWHSLTRQLRQLFQNAHLDPTPPRQKTKPHARREKEKGGI